MVTRPVCDRHPEASITIGNNVRILNTLHENLAGIEHPTVLVADRPGAVLIIGNHVGISGAILYCTHSITIEDHVMIGANAKIYDTDFHSTDPILRRMKNPEAIARAPVLVQEDAWIGAEAVILKGVTVGKRAVVAARAVVTRDVPADCVVAGVPAKVVKLLAK
jgi:acetyltransferase-like isoleucine patch superfamily enzyme